jgi:hypothetical protein
MTKGTSIMTPVSSRHGWLPVANHNVKTLWGLLLQGAEAHIIFQVGLHILR